MRWISLLLLLVSTNAFSQWKTYTLNDRGDTLDRIDMNGKKQGPWVNHVPPLRGEPGYTEQGFYRDDRKEGEWHIFNNMGDMVGVEHYKWGLKDGLCQYFGINGNLVSEQSWMALNPDKVYDTIEVEDLDKLNTYHTVVVKNEGAAIRNGTWKYYNPQTGEEIREETFTLGKLEQKKSENTAQAQAGDKAVPKPKAVLEFEKKNKGKKKVRYQDGSTGGY